MLHKTKKQLGKLEVPALGMGCVNLSGLYGKALSGASEVLNFAFENGVNFFDTADAYANGENEKLLANWMSDCRIARDQVILSSKCGVVFGEKNVLASSVDNSPAYIKAACEASLKRFNTDYIDLYYLHRVANNGESIEASMEALKDLVKEGKIRHVGLSEVNESIIRRAHEVLPLSAIQSEYSLMTRDSENNGVLDACQELGIGFVAYSPLCRGLLSENFNPDALSDDDFRHKFPRFKQENVAQNMALVKSMEAMAAEKSCSVVQLSLAWVMAQGEHIVPIPGTKSIRHLSENIESSHVVLTASDLETLDTLFKVGSAAGERYSKAILRSFNLTEKAQ